jgi:hypothetical protein
MIDITVDGLDESCWMAGAYIGVSADLEDEPHLIEMRQQAVAILLDWA